MAISKDKLVAIARRVKLWGRKADNPSEEPPVAQPQPEIQQEPKVEERPEETFDSDSPWLGKDQAEVETSPIFSASEPLLAPIDPPIEEKAPPVKLPDSIPETASVPAKAQRRSERVRYSNHWQAARR